MNFRRLLAFLGLAIGTTAVGAPLAQQQVDAPPGAKQILTVLAQGVQIYNCTKGADSGHWVFSAPDAALFDAEGRQIGRHYAGPTWQLDDGSKIVGEVVAQAPAPETDAIAWLLLKVRSHEGNGVLSGIDFVRRIDTIAGTAPMSCSPASEGVQVRMRYVARYLFYAVPR